MIRKTVSLRRQAGQGISGRGVRNIKTAVKILFPWGDISLDEGETVSLSFSLSDEIQKRSLGSSVMLKDVKCRVRKVLFEEEHVHLNLEFDDAETSTITHCARYIESVSKVLPE